ncbi:glycosyltransferase [bacterium]|nr:MAG: glycosyltransferase [bacterium]
MAKDLKNKPKPKPISKPPLVSVVMSVYNGEKYLREAIDSILNQIFTDFEFIIINDGSTDDTLKIIKDYKDPRIVLISRKNKGLVASLNEGIKKARGKYIARMDADDISLPERFEKQVEYLEGHPEIDLVASQIQTFYNNRDELIVYKPITSYEIYYLLGAGSIIAHPSVIMRKNAVKKTGLYKQAMWPAEDYDLWSRIVNKSNAHNLPEVLLRYRINSQGISDTNKELQNQQTVIISGKIRKDIIGLNRLSLYIKLLYLQKSGKKLLPNYSTKNYIVGLATGVLQDIRDDTLINKLLSIKIKIILKLVASYRDEVKN